MHAYRFANFHFNRERLELQRDGVRLSLRPKTASLLRLLIDRRTQIVAKRSLRCEIWHSEHVQDQSLFQAISELRKALAPLEPIITHPNLGYQWVAPVREVGARWRIPRAFVALAASLTMAAGVAYLVSAGQEGRTETGEAVEGDPQHSYHNFERAGFQAAYLRDNFVPVD